MKKLENEQMELVNGGDSCEATVSGIFAFGATIVAVPGIGIVGGVAMAVAGLSWALGGCGYK